MLIATPETTWSTPKVTVATACSRPPTAPNRTPPTTAPHPAPLPAGEAGAPGAQDHHPLEADVDHARALGEEPAEGGQPDRHGEDQGRGEDRRDAVRPFSPEITRTMENDAAGRRPVHTQPAAAPAAGQQVGDRAAAGPAARPGWSRRCSCLGPLPLVGVACRRPTRAAVRPRLPPPPPPAPPGGAARAPARSAERSASRRATSLAMTTASTIVPWMIVTTDEGMSANCSGSAARSRKANSSAAIAMPDRAVAAEQGDRDAQEAQPGGELRAVVVGVAEQVRQADQPGDRAGDQHRLDDHAAGVDAAGAGRRRREPRGPQVEAEAGALEQDGDDDADHDRDQQEPVELGARLGEPQPGEQRR